MTSSLLEENLLIIIIIIQLIAAAFSNPTRMGGIIFLIMIHFASNHKRKFNK